jgi:predicted nucleotidyltransferase
MLYMLQKCNLWNVGAVFFDDPKKEFELMEISRKIGLAHTSVKNHLLTLIEMNIIIKGNVKFGNKSNPCYFANKRHPLFMHYKKIYNLECLYNSGIIEYIKNKCQPNCIVLFGSFQRGEDTQDSDIDIFVECSEINLNLKKYENKLNRKLEIHFKNNFKEYPNELKNNLVNGIVLSGFLEGYDA